MTLVTVNGQATSFDLPQYVGSLFRLKRQPNNFLRLIGGLAGQLRLVSNVEYPIGVDYEIPNGAQTARLEGATPTASEIGTTQGTNILQIFHEAVDLTYTRQSVSSAIAGLAVVPGAGNGPLNQPGTLAWQIERKLEKIQNDMNYSFLRGTYVKPVDNTTGRAVRGVRTAVTTHLFANAGTPRPLTKVLFEDSLRTMVDNKAFPMGATVYVLGDAFQLDKLQALYAGSTQLPESREIVGVQVRIIYNMWATCVLVYEPAMPAGELFICQPQYITPVAMPIVADGKNKGLLFAEPLSKTGSADKYQLYGEWGVDYTHEMFHGVVDDLATS